MAFLAIHTHLLNTAVISLFVFISATACQINCTNIKLQASSSTAYLTSPNYPNKYPSSMDCQWHITADMYSYSSVVVIEIQQFTLEEAKWFEQPRDYVQFYDGATVDSPLIKTLYGRGYTSMKLNSTNQVMTVVFHSDQYNNYAGFSFKYFTKEKPVPCTSVNLLATKNSNDIYSPRYSADRRSMDCLWVIKADSDSSVMSVELILLFSYMDSTENEQYVSVYDGPTTTSTRIVSVPRAWTRVNSTNSYMTIQYYSRWKSSGNFKFTYWSQALTNNIGRPTYDPIKKVLFAKEAAAYFTSPNYPDKYPSLVHYQWQIHAGKYDLVIVLELIDFNLEGSQPTCEHDYVEIYNGKIDLRGTLKPMKLLCGQVSSQEFISSAHYMTVVFRSDKKNNYKGFRFKYSSKWEIGNQTIIGSIVAGTLFFISIIILVCLLGISRKWRRNTLREISNQDTLSPEVITQSRVLIVSQATSDPSIPQPTYREVQNSQNTSDPPSYSSICAHLNDNSPGSTSRTPDYNELDLPPSYSSAVNNTSTSHRKPVAQPVAGGNQNATRMPTSSATGTHLSTGITPVMFRPSYFSAAPHPRNTGSNTNIGAPPVYASVPHNQHGRRHQSRQPHSLTYDL